MTTSHDCKWEFYKSIKSLDEVNALCQEVNDNGREVRLMHNRDGWYLEVQQLLSKEEMNSKAAMYTNIGFDVVSDGDKLILQNGNTEVIIDSKNITVRGINK